MTLLRNIVAGLAVLGIAAYLGILAGLYFLQRDFQYDRGGRMFELSETALTNAELVSIPTDGGAALAGWYAPPAAGRPTILYFRGNARSFSREYGRYEQFVADGYGFLAFDYRGFPGSPGEISEENILADGLAAYDWLAARGGPVLLWGRSLGSGPASYVASRREAAALLLETPFVSAVAVAADRYGFLPVGLLMFDQFPVEEWIAGVEEPVFVAHGRDDATIGVTHGERVYALAPVKAGLWIEADAGHGDLWEHGLWRRARQFFEAAL